MCGASRSGRPIFVWIGANAILLYFLNGLIGFEPVATRLVGDDVQRLFR